MFKPRMKLVSKALSRQSSINWWCLFSFWKRWLCSQLTCRLCGVGTRNHWWGFQIYTPIRTQGPWFTMITSNNTDGRLRQLCCSYILNFSRFLRTESCCQQTQLYILGFSSICRMMTNVLIISCWENQHREWRCCCYPFVENECMLTCLHPTPTKMT